MENKFLRFFAPGNHSFTGIVNHKGEGLRAGKNSDANCYWQASSLSHLRRLFDVGDGFGLPSNHLWIQQSMERG